MYRKHQPEDIVKQCPHCQFLVRDDMRACEVCAKPLAAPIAVPAFAAGQRTGDDIIAGRVGTGEAGFPVAAVWLLVLGVLLAVAVVLSTVHWG